MSIAEKLAKISKRAKELEEEIYDLKKFEKSIRDEGFGFKYFYFKKERRFHKIVISDLLVTISAEIELLNQELEQLSKPEYLAEILKGPDNA